jgi:hypothetical protein
VSIVPGLNSQNDVFVGKKGEVHHQLKSRRRQTKLVRARGSKRAPKTTLPFWSAPAHLPFSFQQFFSSTTSISTQRPAILKSHRMSSLELQLSPSPLLAIKGVICFTCLKTAPKLNKCGSCKRVSLVDLPLTLAHI